MAKIRFFNGETLMAEVQIDAPQDQLKAVADEILATDLNGQAITKYIIETEGGEVFVYSCIKEEKKGDDYIDFDDILEDAAKEVSEKTWGRFIDSSPDEAYNALFKVLEEYEDKLFKKGGDVSKVLKLRLNLPEIQVKKGGEFIEYAKRKGGALAVGTGKFTVEATAISAVAVTRATAELIKGGVEIGKSFKRNIWDRVKNA